jgi:hypothetical protein
MVNKIHFSSKGIYDLGKNTISHKGKSVPTVLHLELLENLLTNLDQKSFVSFEIPPQLANRSDLISQTFYGTPFLDWYVMATNNIFDPFESLNSGDVIKWYTL